MILAIDIGNTNIVLGCVDSPPLQIFHLREKNILHRKTLHGQGKNRAGIRSQPEKCTGTV